MKMPKDWFNAIRKCSIKASKWIEEHPGVDAKVQFNYPEGVFLAALPQDAIEQKYVTVDEAGMDLLKAMGAFDERNDAPSISMVRFALEYMEEIKKETATDGDTRQSDGPPEGN